VTGNSKGQRRSDSRCSTHKSNSIQCAEIVIRTVVEKTNMGASSNWAGGGLRPEAHSTAQHCSGASSGDALGIG
jgi:hypothetical protein